MIASWILKACPRLVENATERGAYVSELKVRRFAPTGVDDEEIAFLVGAIQECDEEREFLVAHMTGRTLPAVA